MVMRWNEEEEVGRLCVVDGVVVVSVDGVVVVSVVAELDVLRSCSCAGFGLLDAVTGVGWELVLP